MLRRIPFRGNRIASLKYNSRRHYSVPHTLPFKINRETANKMFIEKRSFLEPGIKNSTAVSISVSDPVKECFIPVHAAGFKNVVSDFVCKYGIDRTEFHTIWIYNSSTKTTHPHIVPVTVTDWYDAIGKLKSISYPFGTKWSQIYAGFDYPRHIIETVSTIEKDHLGYLQPLAKEMLQGDTSKRIVYPHEMNIGFALEKINAKLRDTEKDRVYSYVKNKYKADHVKIINCDVKMENVEIDLHSFYIPMYIFNSDFYELSKYHAINAFTGDSMTNNIYSVVKSAIMGAGIGGFLGLGFAALSRPYLLPVEIAVRILLTSGATSAFAAILAKFRNVDNNKKYSMQMQNDAKLNFEYKPDPDDLARREFTRIINETFEYVVKNRQRFPADKLKLLGLDTETEITPETIKMAYYREIKRWHPDTNPNKDIAQLMTCQIISAKKELDQIVGANI